MNERLDAMKAVVSYAKTGVGGGNGLWAKGGPIELVEAMIAEAEAADADPLNKARLAIAAINDVPLIEPMLALSTAHITKATNDWLMNIAGTPMAILGVYERAEFGWFVAVPGDDEGLTVGSDEGEVPEELYWVLTYARDLGCVWVLFDQDADTIEGLPTYDW